VAPRLDLLILQRRVRPLIVVMPPGSPSTYDRATEWANAPGRAARWFTYLTHDLIHAVDARLRTVRSASGRGIGGYSSGADAALNAILLHPHLYSVAEGWSGTTARRPPPSTAMQRSCAISRRSTRHPSEPPRWPRAVHMCTSTRAGGIA
jgi:S-formylglutathione hydrolase FrmB